MHRKSYWKTISLAMIIVLFCISFLIGLNIFGASSPIVIVLSFSFKIITFIASLIVVGGFVCLWRDKKIELGHHDSIGASLKGMPPTSILSNLGLRFILGRTFRPGDVVEVKSLSEIQKTLDDDCSLDGLPFMPEMEKYCGLKFQVHRRVDKIYDMRNKTGMRRLHDAVTLTSVRCNGEHHDNCQAECHILWKDSWLRKASDDETVKTSSSIEQLTSAVTYDHEAGSYICQMTRLWEATKPMSSFDIRQDLRPLISGNVNLSVYIAVLLTRLFNVVQRLRGGASFPYMSEASTKPNIDEMPKISLSGGRSVVIKSRKHLSKTLYKSKTKGLWYDKDMIRFCGNSGVVYKSVDQIIHEGTGKMVNIKTPCWILKDITATGEFQRLNPQQEYTYWREAWLQIPPNVN